MMTTGSALYNQQLLNLFLDLVSYDTRSDDGFSCSPSTPGQTVLLKEIIKMIGSFPGGGNILYRVIGDGSMIVAMPPSAGKENIPPLAFAAHVDTYYGCPGRATPVFHEYESGNLRQQNGNIIKAELLAGLEGKTIITSTGDSLLGGDDKAGVAMLIELIRHFLRVPHPKMYFWFCVDEELARLGVEHIPEEISREWSMLITPDGTDASSVSTECFSCEKIVIKFTGQDSHAGLSGHNIKPAHYAAARVLNLLAYAVSDYCPWNTSGKVGFLYTPEIKGNASEATLTFFNRTFDSSELEEMKAQLLGLAETASEDFGVQFDITHSEVMYNNIADVISTAPPQQLEALKNAFNKVGVELQEIAERCGTDGAMLNNKIKVPAYNVGTGGRNLHSTGEFLVVEEFFQVYSALVEFITNHCA